MRILKFSILFFILCQFSCGKDKIEFQLEGPLLLATTQFPDLLVQEAGNDIFQVYSLQAARGILRFEVFLDGQLIESIAYDDAITDTYSFLYTIPQSTPNGTESEFNFVLTDIENEQVTKKIRFLVNATFFETEENINGIDIIRIKGKLNRDYTMSAANTYLVEGIFSVENDSELTIEAGTTVYFQTYEDPNQISSLTISQGSKIIAEGTATEPIILTSDKILTGQTPSPIDWGGLLIYGKAPAHGGVVLDRGFRYGGNVPNDNSGILSYIRSEYVGDQSSDDDAYPFHFLGLGSATQIDHLQTYKNENIAFRVRGGRVNLKYISAIEHGGYGIWADRGWQGNGQFWLFQTDQATQIDAWGSSRAIEMRNDPDNFLRIPRTIFLVSNVTCIGNGYEAGVNNGQRRGMRIRTGAIGTFQNAIFTGYPNDAVRVEDLDIEVLGVDMIFDNIRSFDNSKNYEQEARTIFFESGLYNVTEEPVPGISLSNFVGSSPSPFNPSAMGSFFSSAPYIGAVESISNDWTTEGNWFKNLDGSIR